MVYNSATSNFVTENNSTMTATNPFRNDFPILSRKVHNKPLIYLDNGATTQKPNCVIEKEKEYYSSINSNIHRGVHHLSQLATGEFEAVRETVAAFLNAPTNEEIIFTKGTTDGINMIAACYGRTFLKEGDEVVISTMEHHSNIVPWQMICEERKASLKVIPMHPSGELDIDAFEKLLSDRTKMVSVVHVSNTLGTVNPIETIINKAHQRGIPVLLDAAQSVSHFTIDVQALDVDFLVFSSHKLFGPTGVGVLYGKSQWLNQLPPYQGGGDMIKEVTFEKTTYNVLPHKFEAGTPNIAGVIGLGEAVKYVQKAGFSVIQKLEDELLQYATEQLLQIDGLKIYGTAQHKVSVISFLLDGVHPFDVGTILDQLGIAVRTGHHCTQPLMQYYNIPGTVRASFSFYNTIEDVDALVAGVKKAQQMLS
jgi:cysteine desulfurase / selenocysteine lyase